MAMHCTSVTLRCYSLSEQPILHNFAIRLHLVIADSEEDKDLNDWAAGSEAISINSQRDFDPAIYP